MQSKMNQQQYATVHSCLAVELPLGKNPVKEGTPK
jgi:hypothetical protein